jgi:hypothetical protein
MNVGYVHSKLVQPFHEWLPSSLAEDAYKHSLPVRNLRSEGRALAPEVFCQERHCGFVSEWTQTTNDASRGQ